MSPFDRRLPADSASVLDLAKRFMHEEIEPRILELETALDPSAADLPDVDALGLSDILSTEDLGTSDQRQALLLALGRVLGQTDAGIGMALLTGAFTERATGVRAGFGVEIARPHGQGAVLLAAGHRTVVLMEGTGGGCLAELGMPGAPLLGLRLGGGQLVEAMDPSGDGLSPEGLASLRRDLALAALSVAMGTAEGSVKAATDYAEERYQGGTLIARHHAVGRMLGSMADHIAHAEVLLGALLDGPEEPTWSSLLTKGFDACEAVVTDGVQVLGGYGYMREYGQEKRMRDAKTLRLLFGSPVG